MSGHIVRRFRLYVDESGDHVFHGVEVLEQPGHRYLALVGCWVEQGDPYQTFHDALECLKREHFPHGPDEPVILHREHLVNQRGPFWRLRDPDASEVWNEDALTVIKDTPFIVMGVVVDKLALQLRDAYPLHPYHIALAVVLEGYCGFLNHFNRLGDVMAEARGGTENRLLADAYRNIRASGTRSHDSQFFRRVLTSREIKIKPKSANVAGLQLADLLAHPVRQDILADVGATWSEHDTFGRRLVGVLQDRADRYQKRHGLAAAAYRKVFVPPKKKTP